MAAARNYIGLVNVLRGSHWQSNDKAIAVMIHQDPLLTRIRVSAKPKQSWRSWLGGNEGMDLTWSCKVSTHQTNQLLSYLLSGRNPGRRRAKMEWCRGWQCNCGVDTGCWGWKERRLPAYGWIKVSIRQLFPENDPISIRGHGSHALFSAVYPSYSGSWVGATVGG